MSREEPTAANVMTDGVMGISKDSSIKEASSIMKDENVRSLVVTEDEAVIGIVLDRDIAYGAVSEGKDPKETAVSEVMTSDLITAAPRDRIGDIARAMIRNNISRVPILRGDRVVGMVTNTDIMTAWPSYMDLLKERNEILSLHDSEDLELESGVCDSCGNYSEELIDQDGEMHCVVCRGEAE